MPVTFSTTVRELVDTVMVAADCHVIEVSSRGAQVIRDNLTPRHVILAVNRVEVKDRSELRSVLRLLQQNDTIEVTYDMAAGFVKRVEIDDSVECNGERSVIVPHRPSEDTEGEDEDLPPPAAVEYPLSDLSPNASRTSSLASSRAAVAADQLLSDEPSSFFGTTTSPRLLAFDAMEVSNRNAGADEEDEDRTIRGRLLKAVRGVSPGCCIVCVCVDVNPIAEIELLAMQLKQRVTIVDLAVKLRLRPKAEAVAAQIIDCLKTGAWFIFTHANKSIATLKVLEEILRELREHNLNGVHDDARIIICTEPHPHFPRLIMQGAIITKIHTSFANSSLLSATMASSNSYSKLVVSHTTSPQAHKVAAANNNTLQVPHTVQVVPSNAKRRVRISAAVDIVDIEPRDVLTSAGAKSQSNRPIDVSGSVALVNAFSGLLNDKFLCVTTAGEPGRFAVGSSLGNVYFLDAMGNSMLQVHAHDASIWDLSFRTKFEFATACEDGNASQWCFSLDSDSTSELGLEQKAVSSLGADAYCVAYANVGHPDAPLVVGGLANNVLVRRRDGTTATVATPSNAQVLCSVPTMPTVLVGGGDGSIALLDPMTQQIVHTLTDHTRKVPTVTVRDASQFFSGSFDSTIRAWDHRAPSAHSTHTLKLKNYVTGLSVDDVHLAASVGENLYLWDVRKLNEVLGGYPQGWKGLSRGIRVQSESRMVVTASPDGNVRFWHFV